MTGRERIELVDKKKLCLNYLEGNQCSAKFTSKRRCFQKNYTQMHHTSLQGYSLKKETGDGIGKENVEIYIPQS